MYLKFEIVESSIGKIDMEIERYEELFDKKMKILKTITKAKNAITAEEKNYVYYFHSIRVKQLIDPSLSVTNVIRYKSVKILLSVRWQNEPLIFLMFCCLVKEEEGEFFYIVNFGEGYRTIRIDQQDYSPDKRFMWEQNFVIPQDDVPSD